MIARALVVALWCACAGALAPLAAPADDDCALYLTGPGRSSAYDYSLNLLKGNFGYEGQHTCITYEAINQAYLDARNRILVSQPKGDWKAEDFASVGELLLDISISLARTYGLTYEEIEKGLPLIDTSRTLIREACPPVFSHVECRAGKYRRLDGLCNNLRHPTWGATMAPFQRLIGPLFADGINAPRIAHSGHELPLSRVVSRTMHPDDGFHDHAGTVMVIAWGQFMDHDYTLTGTPLDPINRNDPEECCKRPPHLKHPYCNEIRVPDDDYFYRLWGVKCIDFVRGFPSPRPGCRLGSRVPFNTLTGSIDGNTVYGVTEKFARKLRTGYGGFLRMNPVFKEYGLKDLLPLKLDIPDEGCTRPNKNMYCFEAGEIRVNEQLVLTVMHTLMAREHNRVAEGLAGVNPHWDDETLFQEARRINIAEIQHITYNEFLPILLGKDVMEKFGLVLEKEGYWNGYDPEVNPDVLASFAAAAYRFGHSLLPTAVERWSKAHKFIASKRLSDLIRRPYDLYRAGVLDEYVMGLMNQVAQAMDDSITQEVTNHLFKKVGARFGMDLVSFNMQRGREFGLPGYMEFRKFCGLSGADTFQDLFGSMPNETVRKYESIFEHPIDVDLWSGGVSERPLPGSMLGPTFACIIATQFSYSRRGDRFWFELPNQPSSFTPEQLTEIRKSRLARIICDNTDIIDTVQLYPMVLPDHELNPRVPCRSGIIPSMDFSKWAEAVPFHGTAKQFITDAIATNKFVNDNKYSNESNAIDVKTEKDIDEDKTAGNLCQPITIPVPGLLQENISIKLHINQTSRSAKDKQVKENCQIDAYNTKVCKGNPTKSNLHENTVHNYLNKNTNQKIFEKKSTGHIKNSILRRKRSIEIEPSFYKRDIHIPYSGPHGVRINGEFNLLKNKNGELIKKNDLADFNIETLHKDSKLPKNADQEGYNKPYSNIETLHKDSKLPKKADKEDYNKPYPNIDTLTHSRSIKENNRRYEPQHHDTIKERKSAYKPTESISESKESDESDENTYSKKQKSTHSKQIPYDESLRSKPIVNTESHKKPYPEQYRESLETPKSKYDPDGERHEIPYSGKITYDESHKSPRTKHKPHTEALETSHLKQTHSDEHHEKSYSPKIKSKYDPDGERHEIPYSGKITYDENHKSPRTKHKPHTEALETPHLKQTHSDEHQEKSYSPKIPYNENQSHDSKHVPSGESHKPPHVKLVTFNESFKAPHLIQTPYGEKHKIPYSGIINYGENHKLPHSKHIPYGENHNAPPSQQNKAKYEINEYTNGSVNNYKEKVNTDDHIKNNHNKNIRQNSYIPNDDLYSKEVSFEDSKSIENNEERFKHDKFNADKIKHYKINSDRPITPRPLQDVDLGDFSYERIQVNNKGKVEPIKEFHENYDSVELIQTTTSKSKLKSEKNSQLHAPLTIRANSSVSDHFSKPYKQIPKLNAEEVKPVVELNNENSESSVESSKEFQSADTSNKEKYDGSSEEDQFINKGSRDKHIEFNESNEDKANVKEQFERIPLDYNHVNKSQIKIDNTEKHATSEEPPDENDGTLDALAPKKDTYDEHLKIKFGDVSIKLPEINLPDDILSYAQIGAPKDGEYYYKDEESDETPIEYRRGAYNADKNYDFDNRYNSYVNKDHEDYKKPSLEDDEDDDDDVDLYEKFVRERFGKKTSLGKQSEKLQAQENKLNSKLLDNVRKILKKTEQVQNDAEKSGDPNAGYMWTLEYGEDL